MNSEGIGTLFIFMKNSQIKGMLSEAILIGRILVYKCQPPARVQRDTMYNSH